MFFYPYFPPFQNTSVISVVSPITRKYGPEKTPYLDTFHVVTGQTFFKFVKGYYHKIENLIQSQMNDNFNQEIFKVIDKSRSKYKQQANVKSIFELIIKAIGNESISKAFRENRIEALVTDDMLENKPRLEKYSYGLTEKSKQLLLNIDGDIIEPLIQSQNTPSKYFTASETENYGNKLPAFKAYVMEELNDLKNRLEVLNNLGNGSCRHEASAILKEEIQNTVSTGE